MITDKDAIIISHLRKNARKKITEIAVEEGIPATTIYDKVNLHEKKGLFRRHVTLLDFNKLGLYYRHSIVIKNGKADKIRLLDFLSKHKNVNSLYKLNLGFDYLCECAFRNVRELESFLDEVAKSGASETIVYNIAEEIKKEAIFSDPSHMAIIDLP